MTQDQAIEILKTGANVFLTGEPGSGKTYVSNLYISYLKSHGIEPAITASTGIAATHLGGVTIHSWSGIGIKESLSKGEIHKIASQDHIKRRINKSKVLIIDEISMLPPNALDAVEAICREVKENNLPFGGLQVILSGDFFQLPPVVKNKRNDSVNNQLLVENIPMFAYQGEAWQNSDFTTCYLTEQHRQQDEILLQLLKNIRNNIFSSRDLNYIAKRKTDFKNLPQHVPKLYSHNFDVDEVNFNMLGLIAEKERRYFMKTTGEKNLLATMKKGCLSPEELVLKIGAKVMFTKNSPEGKYVNGSLGEVFGFDGESELPIIKLKNGRKIKADFADWTIEEEGKIKGRLTQIPLRLAWAITVHKSQGIGLDEAIIDLSRVFEYGQGYVALSRVRTFEGLHILGFNEKAFYVNPEILERDQHFRRDSEHSCEIYANLPEGRLKTLKQDFIIRCHGTIDTIKIDPKSCSDDSTYDKTLALWSEGCDIIQISKHRKLSLGTILNHIEKLVERKKILKADLSRFAQREFLSEIKDIQTAFQQSGSGRLSPIFNRFKGKYSYETLRIAKLLLLLEPE